MQRATLATLLNQPQVAERTIKEMRSASSRRQGSIKGSARASSKRAAVEASAVAERGTSTERQQSSQAVFEESKMDGLLGMAVLIRAALERATEQLAGEATLVVLDDFYHINYDDQPDVLAYLHQVTKNLDIYLKVCGVRHRLQPFV